MIAIPYLPKPYPDEILGSWLSSIRLHNGEGTWSSLLVAAGFQRWLKAPYFDLFQTSPQNELLFQLLGKTRASVWMELTTLPYWITFDGLINHQPEKHFNEADIEISNVTGRVDNFFRLTQNGNSTGTLKIPHFCPVCVSEDYEEYGEPYWHRAHQLPNVTACHKHQCKLMDRCRACGLVIAPIQRKLINPLKLKCTCDHLLSSVEADSFNMSEVDITIAKLSFEALTVDNRNWNNKDVRNFILESIGTKSWVPIIKQAFGKSHQVTKHSRVKWRQVKAPDCAALLVAKNISFQSAVEGFRRHASDATQNQEQIERSVTSYRIDKLTVDFARKELLKQISLHPNKPPSHYRNLYWFLKINDYEWLIKLLPSAAKTKLPTIEQDRNIILKLMESDAPSIETLYRKSLGRCPGIRARIRDKSWVDQQLKMIQIKKARQVDQKRNAIRQEQKNHLLESLHRYVKNEKRPKRITRPQLAHASGMTHSQVDYLLIEFPEIEKEILKINNDKQNRTLIWAINTLKAEGKSLGLSEIYRVAKLPATKDVQKDLARILQSETIVPLW
ncbi:hypothetical protein C3Y98_02760 [Methylotenera oryzisoli]|jgi:hypothetical protein|uniref:TniQ domain-containing protein n=1 Tax=Methylotenera oryzisoli TaxID=2080758 RepID=A0A4Y9VTV4_9PROT|nr:TniQ family protein [Methylotenera oryzisoli]TFW72545.1 hypothetical protein C3Y98_02760 [Methylotenera oryzisoli]